MDIKSPQTRTTDRCDREVMTAWRAFLEVMHRHDVPTDAIEAMVQLDHALFKWMHGK